MARLIANALFTIDDMQDLSDPILRTKTTTGYLLEDAAGESALLQGVLNVKNGELAGSLTALTRYSFGLTVERYSLTGVSASLNNNYFDDGYMVDGVLVGAGTPTAEMAYWLRGSDVIYGSPVNDKLAGFSGNDVVYAGYGDDTVMGWSGNDSLFGGADDDLIYGDNTNNTTTANYTGNDKLFGDHGNDTIYGCGGNDVLDGGDGINYMDGGLGNDTYYVYNPDDVVNEIESGGIDTVISAASFAIDNPYFENLTLTGTAYMGLGNRSVNILTGSASNNYLDGVANTNTRSGDRMIGGDGDDVYYVHSTKDVVLEKTNEGLDGIFVVDLVDQNTGRNVYSIAKVANVENLSYWGRDGAGTKEAVLTGNNLDNSIWNNGSFASTLSGGLGNDYLMGGDGSDLLDGGAGNDKIYTSLGDDKIVMNTNGFDIVSDFTRGAGTSGDKLYFNPAKFTKLKNGIAFDEVDSSAEVVASTTAIIFNTADQMVYYNATAKIGGAVAICELVGVPTLAASDIITSLVTTPS